MPSALLMGADQITFGQVLRILDGPLAPLLCLSRCADCRTEEARSGGCSPG
jgi:DNA-binding IscR family transcriptional regulator